MLRVIGAGVGRTGTYSLRSALNELGLGPTHHMEEVMHHLPVQVPLWQQAVDGKADWPAIYDGYQSAVDWPTAGFFRELNAAYPDTRFILTVRSPESWTDSFSETIYKLLAGRDDAPPQLQDWFAFAAAVVVRTGFPPGLARAGLTRAFEAHTAAVKATIPAERLLVYEVAQGWEPLCAFLGLPVPDTAFPRSNSREDFWERIRRGSDADA